MSSCMAKARDMSSSALAEDERIPCRSFLNFSPPIRDRATDTAPLSASSGVLAVPMMITSLFLRWNVLLNVASTSGSTLSTVPGKQSFPSLKTRVVAPMAPLRMAASLSSRPYLILLAANGTRTAQSNSLMVRYPTSMWTMSMSTLLRIFMPSSDRYMPVLSVYVHPYLFN